MCSFEKTGETKRAREDLYSNKVLGKLVVEVVDTGVGIKAENMHMLFKPFSKLPDEHQLNPRGNGLGLSVVK